MEEYGADVKVLVKRAMNEHSCGRWFLFFDDADDVELFPGTPQLYDYLPSRAQGLILFTTRPSQSGDKARHLSTKHRDSDENE